MAGGRPIFAFVSLILVAGACLLNFLILLAGITDHSPVNKFYFLQADTSKIPGAPAMSRWTYWNICSVKNGLDTCGHVHPAFPFDPPSTRNFGTHTGVPKQFIGTHMYFYLTRFMFALNLIALFFAVSSLFSGLLALCTRIGSYLSGLLAMIAAFFSVVTAALMTAAYIKGRDAFRSNKEAANIGKYAFGFMWASFACLFLASILYCVAGGRKDTTTTTTSSRRVWFGGKNKNRRSRSTKSRASFMDGDEKRFAA